MEAIRPILGAFLIAGVACDGGDRDRPSVIVLADSAGIPTILNPSPQLDTLPPYQTSATPIISIGSEGGEAKYTLFEVDGGALLSSGRIVLANAGTHELRFYDSIGTYLRSAGREGSGPGEFRLLNWGGTYAADSIVAVDGLLRRATIFDPAGSYVRSFPLPTDVSATLSEPLGVLWGGGILFTPAVRDTLPPPARWATTGMERRPRQAVVARRDGRVDTVEDELPGDEWFRNVENRSMLRVPLGRRLHGVAAGERIALGTDDAFRIHVYDQKYRLLRVIVQDGMEREVKKEDYWGAAHEEILSDLTMPSARASARQVLEELPWPGTWPRFLELRLDRTGNLWVRESVDMKGEGDLWSIFDAEGRLARRVQVPPGFNILDVRDGKVLALIEDELGIERVEVYEIVRPH